MGEMTCLRDGSPMREVIVAPEFSVYECVEACHSLRVGETPAPPRTFKNGEGVDKYIARQAARVWKDDSYCAIATCASRRVGNNFCVEHLAAARRRYQKRKVAV